jgi:tripartite-type tricarboxylate transporter receptor subunit TctC
MKLLLAFLLVLVSLALAVQDAPPAKAQHYPARPITLISPTPAGGANDMICRILGAQLAERLGKPVVIENRPGAGFVIGTAAGARAAPDGYTLVMPGSSALAANVTIYKRLPYDPTKDFAPVALVSEVPMILVVHPSLPVRSVPEFIAWAKEKRGQFSYASAGPGTPQHLLAELFKSMTGIEMLHVPYRGGASAVADVASGHVPVIFADPVSSLPLVREGRLRALAVSTKIRLPSAPEIPPLAEAGVSGFNASAWTMIAAPARTPKDIVNRLHAELRGIVGVPEVQQQMVKFGVIPIISPSPEDLQPFINSEIARWAKVVYQAGIAGSE